MAILITAIIIDLIFCIYYPKFRGYMGEFWVKNELRKLPKKDYIVLNNIMLKLNDNTTHQIDHIVISKYGIFVIETKNYTGTIYVKEKSRNWYQYVNRRKNIVL